MRTPAVQTWRGDTAEQRREQRRERLLAAGLEVMGNLGWSRTTVRAVCRQSGLTERYFYEAFPDNNALLVAVFDLVRNETLAAVAQAAAQSQGMDIRTQARRTIAAGLAVLLDDPRKGRVLFLEAAYNEDLQRRRHDDTLATAQLMCQIAVESFGLRTYDPIDAELSAVAILGAESALVTAYLAGRIDITRERLLDHITELHLVAAGISTTHAIKS